MKNTTRQYTQIINQLIEYLPPKEKKKVSKIGGRFVMNKQAHNYIFEYHDAITSGRIRAGKWIKAIYKILVEGIKNGEWFSTKRRPTRRSSS